MTPKQIETYKIAQETNITYYDASFMSLAKQLNATLVTDNIKHQGKATDIKVISLKDYSSETKLWREDVVGK